MATSYGQLGILAHRRGDYEAAETWCRQALTIDEQLGNQAGIATSYHQLGVLAYLRGDYEVAAETWHRQALAIFERLGDQAGMAASYHQLGVLAQARGITRPPTPGTGRPWPSMSGSVTRPPWPPA
ncbi:MAG TPA: tetratricopeptide repeat protein [Kineosporiaceae bacterium]|nr:tetratricopeptide repeat protein [Kineosporiaceae bacterium]